MDIHPIKRIFKGLWSSKTYQYSNNLCGVRTLWAEEQIEDAQNHERSIRDGKKSPVVTAEKHDHDNQQADQTAGQNGKKQTEDDHRPTQQQTCNACQIYVPETKRHFIGGLIASFRHIADEQFTEIIKHEHNAKPRRASEQSGDDPMQVYSDPQAY